MTTSEMLAFLFSFREPSLMHLELTSTLLVTDWSKQTCSQTEFAYLFVLLLNPIDGIVC